MKNKITKSILPHKTLNNHKLVGQLLVSDSHRYKSNKGEISLLYPCYCTLNKYEIYCIKGNLFEDIERYDNLEEAEQRINKLLK